MIIRSTNPSPVTLRQVIETAARNTPGVKIRIFADQSTSRHAILRLRLFPDGERHRAISASGRRKNAVTPVGHLLFFRQVYRLYLRAEIITTIATYTSPESLEVGFDSAFRRMERMDWPV